MNPAKQVGQTARDIAENIAKQVAREPLEILKDVGEQVTGIESTLPQKENQESQTVNPHEDISTQQNELKDRAFANRRREALQNEINDIRKQDLVSKLQGDISQGIKVPLENYTELSMDQKQVLKAQMEAVENSRKEASIQASVNEVPAIHSKPSRRFGAGQKQEAEKQKTRVEKPVPPSG